MRKLLQLTLLLSCLLMLCSHSIDVAAKVDVWTTGLSLEENSNDIDNHDLDEISSKYVLFKAQLSLTEQLFFFEINGKKTRLTYSFIRAPPTYNI